MRICIYGKQRGRFSHRKHNKQTDMKTVKTNAGDTNKMIME
jgi:hypothetical protein